MEKWTAQVFVLENDGNVAIALYNEDDQEDDFNFNFEWLNKGNDPIVSTKIMKVTKGTKASVRDLWKHEDLGEFVG